MNDVLKTIDQAKDVDEVFAASALAYDPDQIRTLLDGPIYGRRFAKYSLLRLEHLFISAQLAGSAQHGAYPATNSSGAGTSMVITSLRGFTCRVFEFRLLKLRAPT